MAVDIVSSVILRERNHVSAVRHFIGQEVVQFRSPIVVPDKLSAKVVVEVCIRTHVNC